MLKKAAKVIGRVGGVDSFKITQNFNLGFQKHFLVLSSIQRFYVIIESCLQNYKKLDYSADLLIKLSSHWNTIKDFWDAFFIKSLNKVHLF